MTDPDRFPVINGSNDVAVQADPIARVVALSDEVADLAVELSQGSTAWLAQAGHQELFAGLARGQARLAERVVDEATKALQVWRLLAYRLGDDAPPPAPATSPQAAADILAAYATALGLRPGGQADPACCAEAGTDEEMFRPAPLLEELRAWIVHDPDVITAESLADFLNQYGH